MMNNGRFPQGRAATRRRKNAGFTLVELMISTVVLAILLESMLHGALYMTASGEFGAKHNHVLSQLEMALDRMSNEMSGTSTDVDPVTGLPYLTVTGPAGAEVITFRRVVNYGNNGAELTPIWSSPIIYSMQNGDLVRTQDGTSATILTGATQLDFEVQATGRIVVQLGMTSPAQGIVAGETILQTVSVPTAM